MITAAKIKRFFRETALIYIVGLGFWLVVCLVDSLWYSMVGFSKGKSLTLGEILFTNLPFWLALSLLTPAVALVSRRANFGRGFCWRSVLIHVLCVLPFAILHVTIFRAYYFILKGASLFSSEFYYSVVKYLSTRLDYEILIYVVVVIAVNAFDYYRQFREKEKTAADLELDQARLVASLSEAKLDALKIQLQPHFLFNSLHAISTLIMRGDSKAANEMLMHLSNFLRMTLDSTDAQEVPLSVELEFLDAYLKIQRVRFGDRLKITMNIEEAALGAVVPNLVLQPLVENAIRHGIGAVSGGGEIAISASLAEEDLEISVRDNGIGLKNNLTPVEGVGLGNVRARLNQLYPDQHRFELKPAPDKGTIASITIPARMAVSELDSGE
jgi:two-component system, LytTR family, sensor kinase